jgi:hypothetical protein
VSVPYELRVLGSSIATFASSEEALAHARDVIKDNPDAEPEIFDTATGEPLEPAASKASREDLAKKIGY